MDGWIVRRARRVIEGLARLLEPEIMRARPERRSGVIPAVRGWSLWMDPADPFPALASLIVSYSWDGPVVRGAKPSAVLGPVSYSPCEKRCPDIGFFALKPGRAHAELRRYPSLACVGTVSLFGRVVEHTHGYRAEAVRVDRVWVIEETLGGRHDPHPREIAEALERRYRCDVRVASRLQPAVQQAARDARESTGSSPEIEGG